MAFPSWPTNLPKLTGIAGSTGIDRLGGAVLRSTSFDDGPPRTRRQTLFRETQRKITLKLTRDEFATFEGFLRTQLNAGTKRFTAPVMLPAGDVGDRVCRIVGDVVASEDIPFVTVTLTVAIRDWP